MPEIEALEVDQGCGQGLLSKVQAASKLDERCLKKDEEMARVHIGGGRSSRSWSRLRSRCKSGSEASELRRCLYCLAPSSARCGGMIKHGSGTRDLSDVEAHGSISSGDGGLAVDSHR